MYRDKNKIRPITYFLALIIIFSSLTNIQVFAEDNLSKSLKENMISIETLKSSDDYSDLHKIGRLLEGKKIIGIGESSPGASEFYGLKTRIIKYLVEVMGYKNLAFHGDFADIQVVDNYINGIGNIEDAIWELRPFPWAPEKLEKNQGYVIDSHTYLAPYSTEEFKDILLWIRDYNSELNGKEKIKIYGIAFENPEKSVNDLIDYISNVDPESSKTYKKKLSDLKMVHSLDFKYPEPRPIGLLTGILEELSVQIESNKEDYIKRTSIEEYELAKKNLISSFQWISYRMENLNSGMDQALKLKAQYLSDNVKWILDRESESESGNDNLIIWSNNMDIARNNQDYISMGNHLSREYKDEYYAIGLDFFKGRFRAFGLDIWGSPISNFIAKFQIDKSESDYFSYELEKANIGIGFLDFQSSIENENIKSILEKDQKIHNAGFMYPGKHIPGSLLPYISKQYKVEVPAENYHGFLFVSEISETHGLSDSRDTKIENGDKAIVEHYKDIIAGQIGTILTILLVLLLIIIWLVKRWKKKKTRPGARYPGSSRWG